MAERYQRAPAAPGAAGGRRAAAQRSDCGRRR